jgi:hypothetical protein
MPLVVPDVTTNTSDDKTAQWSNKLVGKKLGEPNESSTETVKTSALRVILITFTNGHPSALLKGRAS